MNRIRLIAALFGAAGLAVASSGSALACGAGKLLFEDKFDKLDPAWGITLKDG